MRVNQGVVAILAKAKLRFLGVIWAIELPVVKDDRTKMISLTTQNAFTTLTV